MRVLKHVTRTGPENAKVLGAGYYGIFNPKPTRDMKKRILGWGLCDGPGRPD